MKKLIALVCTLAFIAMVVPVQADCGKCDKGKDKKECPDKSKDKKST